MLEGMSGKQLDETARDFWASRPRRPRHGRKIAGVAAGVGDRYDIDPVIVRVALAVATLFGGAGVPLYLLGWLFFPDERDEVSAFESMIGKGHSSTSTAFTVILCLALIPASSWLFGGTWFFGGHFSGFLGLILLLGGLYLLQRGRGGPGRAEATDSAAVAATSTAAATGTQADAGTDAGDPPAEGAGTGETPGTRQERTTPPAWDPLGAAPFAWDLPEPTPPPPPPEPPRRKSKVGLITLGAALVTVGVCVGLAPIAGGWMTPPHVIGLVLGVIGIGLVGGSFAHGGRGLIGLAVPLAVVGIVLTNANFGPGAFSGGVGDRHYAPTTLEQVKGSYGTTAGDTTLDLTGLPDSGSTKTYVHDVFGDITVLVPADADVTANCDVGAGEVTCLGKYADGISPHRTVTDNGEDGPGGLTIDLDVKGTAGQVEVRRG